VIPVQLGFAEGIRQLVQSQGGVIEHLAKAAIGASGPDLAPPKGAAAHLAGEVMVYVPLEGFLDKAAEGARLAKEKLRIEGQLKAQIGKLSNAAFVSKAPEAVVAQERAKQAELEDALAKVIRAAGELGA
jgi:valyl-tRNA synthetase